MVESDITFFGSLRFHETCLNFKFFLARTTKVASICFMLNTLEKSL